MPDNLNDILNKMTPDGMIPPKEQPEEPEKEEPEKEEPEKEEPEKEEPEKEEPEKEEPEKSKGEDSSVIRNLRRQYTDTKKQADEAQQILEALAKTQGKTIEQLKADLETQRTEAEAKNKGMSPEVLAEFKKQQQELVDLRQEQKRRDFFTNINKLQTEEKLTDSQIEQFAAQSLEAGFDLTNPNISFEAVYYALNHKTMEDKIRTDERQKVLVDLERQESQSPTRTTKGGSSTSAKKGWEDLYDDLSKLK